MNTEDLSLITVYAKQPEVISKILKTPSMEITDQLPNPEIQGIVETMKQAIYAHPVVKKTGKIAGLAAPQIGISKQIIMVSKNFEIDTLTPMINPRYEKSGNEEKTPDWEMSLSFPLEAANVLRFPAVKVSYTDLDGNTHTEELTGLNGRFAQHYIDFLNGIVYTDLAHGENKKSFKTIEEANEFRLSLRKNQVSTH